MSYFVVILMLSKIQLWCCMRIEESFSWSVVTFKRLHMLVVVFCVCLFTSATSIPWLLYGPWGGNAPGFIYLFRHCINCLFVYLLSLHSVPSTGFGAVMRRDSCVDFGAIWIVRIYLTSFSLSSLFTFIFRYAFFLTYLHPYLFTSGLI